MYAASEMKDISDWRAYDESKFAQKLRQLTPTEQEAVKLFWRSLVLRSQRGFMEENARSQGNNNADRLSSNVVNGSSSVSSGGSVRSCHCCPYGYHIDLDFVRYCEALANAKPSEEELRRRDRRRSRKSMEFMLGFESLFGTDWQAEGRVQPKLIEAAHESEPDSPRATNYVTTPCYRQRSSSVPRFTVRAESPFGTTSSNCSSLRGGVESDAAVYQQHRLLANSPPETRAFLHEALDEVCSDFERTLERASARRRKANGYSMDRNNNKNSLSNGYATSTLRLNTKSHKDNSTATWERLFDVADSCMAGNRSPRFVRSNTLPLQQQPSPAEVQYESYVQATVAANAKSPVEQLESSTLPSPPPPPPRRHHHHQQQQTTPKDSQPAHTSPPPPRRHHHHQQQQTTPKDSQPAHTSASPPANSEAEALYQIREQMALSLKRLKDLEEQVKLIPEMEHELTSLRTEKQRLLRRNEELLRSSRHTPSPPSPSASLKNASSSPVQFTPQRISPISLESLGARMKPNSHSPPAAGIVRHVATMCKAVSTRDVAVGSAQLAVRNVGIQPEPERSVIYTQLELQQRIATALSNEKQQQLKKLISVGTQMYVPQREQRERAMQTMPERKPLSYNAGVTAKPTTRDNYVSCKPELRSVGSGPDKPAPPPPPPQKPVTPLAALPRSNTFSLGESEKVAVKRQTVSCQTQAVVQQQSAGCQTAKVAERSWAVQVAPEQQAMSTQCEPVKTRSQLTDTVGLQRLSRSATKAEQIAEPTFAAAKPLTHNAASNTEAEPAPPAVRTVSCGSNTDEVRKRDVGCGDVVKPHISIACADNYCDSCKEAIKHLAKDFSKATTPAAGLTRSSSADSRIPRPKHLTTSPSPVRRQFKRQNTYTLSPPTPSPSPKKENKTLLSSLQEKPPSLSSFQALESASETHSFIKQPTTTGEGKASGSLDFSQLGEHELVVREEKRVSISWSRDNSPASTPAAAPSSSVSKSSSGSPEQERRAQTSATAAEISQGARKKSSTPLKSSQSEDSQITVIEREPREPTKAQLHKLAMSESPPREKTELAKELRDALKVINDSLLKKLGSKPFSSISLKTSKACIQEHWFRVSSTATANPHEVEDYLDYFESLSVPLLEYCVNLSDENGNTAMHYAVSHGNFDVVSILLDSKVCNVNQMNNAGYTCVMLVSLAKLKQTAHRTVVERLFQMADVNIRAKKHCQTALMLAVSHGNSDMVAMLLASGADINIQDEDGSTALMCAAEHGRVDIVKHLLSHQDCDSLIQDVDGSTAFKIAWQAGHRDVGLLLYVHEQMLRSKMPNRGESSSTRGSSLLSSMRHKRQPSQ